VLPTSALFIRVLALLQGSPVVVHPPATAACQGVRRIELSQGPGTQEICVSPGLLTGFVFDAPVEVELQDEVRFAEVTRSRSRTSIGLMPPKDMVPGERLRLSARYEGGVSVSFVLVHHSGQATHQVEVYRDQRTRESLLHEVEQEHAKNQQLQGELEQLRYQFEQFRAECGDPSGLRRLIVSGTMSLNGIRIRQFSNELVGNSESSLSVTRGATYRSNDRVAVEVWLRNSGSEPWTARRAALVDDRGKELPGMRLWQASAIPPEESRMVVVEADAKQGEPRGDVTLVLQEDGPRSITLQGVAVPP
jgi:uncharacterized protein (TIGR02268 family)